MEKHPIVVIVFVSLKNENGNAQHHPQSLFLINPLVKWEAWSKV